MQKKISEIIFSLTLSDGSALSSYLDSLLVDNHEIYITFRVDMNSLLWEKKLQEIDQLKKDITAAIKQLDKDAQIYINSIKVSNANNMKAKPKTGLPFIFNQNKISFNNIKNIVGIASGKGGVGKSTLTINMAYALKEMGLSVGILDADIYGPSIDFMMGEGVKYMPDLKIDANKIPSFEKDGIKYNSIVTFLEDKDSAIVLKAPMIIKLFNQMLSDSMWGDLDVLLIDLPPGTGDIHLNLALKFNIMGIVIICTPQKLALLDAIKSINMYKKTNTNILGIVENMSAFKCAYCNNVTNIFDSNGTKKVADEFSLDFLGAIPLSLKIRELADAHSNLIKESKVFKNNNSNLSVNNHQHGEDVELQAFLEIANKVSKKLSLKL